MRLVRAPGVSAVLLFAAVALVPGTSATAMTLCKESGEGSCPKEKTYPAKTKITASLGEKEKAVGSDGKELTVECTEAEWAAETTAESGESIPGQVNSSFWAGCSSPILGNCTWEAVNLPYAESITNNNIISWTNGGSGTPALRILCGLFPVFHCRYGAASISAQLTGGNPAIAKINQTLTLEADTPANSAGCGMSYVYKATLPLLPAPLFPR